MKAFISYSHRNEQMLERFHTHLTMLRREGAITDWHDREICAGARLDKEIIQHLNECEIFLALVSPDFLSSEYCYGKEMARAIERHEAGELVVIPVILEPCDWQASPLKEFKALPKDGKPISDWTNKDAAWLNVVMELRRLVQSLRPARADEYPRIARAGSSEQTVLQSKYRVKKTFDEVDRQDFRKAAFDVVRKFFEESCKELDSVQGLRARYESMGPAAFTCTIVNQMMKDGRRGTAHITVRAGPRSVLGDISWSFSPRADENVANGGFTIDHDDYRLFLRGDFFPEVNGRRTWSPDEAANRLWQDFIEHAGISYG